MKTFTGRKKILKKISVSTEKGVAELFNELVYKSEHTKFVWFPYPHRKTFKEGFYDKNRYMGKDNMEEVYLKYIVYPLQPPFGEDFLDKSTPIERLAWKNYYIDPVEKKIKKRMCIKVEYKEDNLEYIDSYRFEDKEEALKKMDEIKKDILENYIQSKDYIIRNVIEYLNNNL